MPSPESTDIRVYNRSSRRSFTHGKYVLAPSSFLTVPEELGKAWLEGYPKEIVDAGVAQAEIGGAQAEIAKLRETVAELEAKKVPAKVAAQIEAKDKEIADLRAQLEAAKKAELT
jgi:hypothetical protein